MGDQSLLDDVKRAAPQAANDQVNHQRIAALAQMTAVLTQSLDLDRVLQAIVEAAIDLVPNTNSSVIHLIDWEQERLIPRAVSPGQSGVAHKLCMSVGQGIAGLVIQEKRIINVPDASHDPRFIPVDTFPPGRSLLTAPLTVDQEIIGTLSLNSHQVGAFSKADEDLLTTLANQAAIAVRNARLHQQVQSRVQELTFLNQIGQTLASSLDPDQVLQTVMENTAQMLDSEAASILLLDNSSEELVFEAAVGRMSGNIRHLRVPVVESIAGQVVREGRPVIVNDVSADVHFYPGIDLVSGLTSRSVLAVPLKVKGKPIGAIEAVNRISSKFTQADVDLLTAMAQPAAIAIDNARLYQDAQDRMEELRRTQEQLIQSARLAAVGKLAEGAAHEINNPLAIIIGFTQLLIESLPDQDPMKADLTAVDQAAARAQRIVRALLDFAEQTEPPRQEPVDVNRVLKNVISLMEGQAQSAAVSIAQTCAVDLPPVLGEVAQISQVFFNIVTNAIQAMPDGGTLHVTTRCGADPSRLSSRKAGKKHEPFYVIIAFQDTGVGISPENLPRIFDPFFTTREVGKGMGLGLAVCHGIVQRHGGKILVESQEGQGSIFTVLMPVLKDRASATPNAH